MSAISQDRRGEAALDSHDGMQMTESELLLAQLSRAKLIQLVCVLGTLAAVGCGLALFAPPLPLPESGLRLPKSLDDIKEWRAILVEYEKENATLVMLQFFCLYVSMMTFAIPGSIFLSILGGAIFGVAKGTVLVNLTASMGASMSYLMSSIVGRVLVLRLFAWMGWLAKLRWFQGEVTKRRRNLLNYIIFLRVTPLLPNTFINIASPIVSVPYFSFLIGTIVGTIPACFLAVRAGSMLAELKGMSEMYDAKTVAALSLIAAAALVPALRGEKAPPKDKLVKLQDTQSPAATKSR